LNSSKNDDDIKCLNLGSQSHMVMQTELKEEDEEDSSKEMPKEIIKKEFVEPNVFILNINYLKQSFY
jgi:hypothetical protein